MSPVLIRRIAGGVALALVATAVVWGFVLVGSPGAARLRKLDERRIDELQQIHEMIQRFWVKKDSSGRATLKKPLPETLDEVVARARAAGIDPPKLDDPQTGDRYEYAVQTETKYVLCATFALERESSHGSFWNHPPGRHCFSFDALRETVPRVIKGAF